MTENPATYNGMKLLRMAMAESLSKVERTGVQNSTCRIARRE
jgi:hypothetical protein